MDSIKTWWAKPYDDDMGVPGWVAFFGLVIAISVFWHIVLRHLKEI